jgi:hypothetical protein
MNQEESPEIYFGAIFEDRKDKIAALKKSITEGTYKVKAEDIAEKILKEWLFELALTIYNHKYQKRRNIYRLAWKYSE